MRSPLSARACRCWWSTAAARRRPDVAVRRSADAPAAADAPVRWLFYTSGTTADPKGVPHTDLTVTASARPWPSAYIRERRRSALVFPFTHIGGIGRLYRLAAHRVHPADHRGLRPDGTPAFLAANGVTLAGTGTPFHLAYLAAQRAAGDDGSSRTCVLPRRRRTKPPQLHHDLKAEIGGVGIVSGYGLTQPDRGHGDDRATRTGSSPIPRVARPPGSTWSWSPSTHRAAPGRGGGDPRSRRPR